MIALVWQARSGVDEPHPTADGVWEQTGAEARVRRAHARAQQEHPEPEPVQREQVRADGLPDALPPPIASLGSGKLGNAAMTAAVT